MTWDQIKGNRKQIPDKAKEKWGNLIDNDLISIEGKGTSSPGSCKNASGTRWYNRSGQSTSSPSDSECPEHQLSEASESELSPDLPKNTEQLPTHHETNTSGGSMFPSLVPGEGPVVLVVAEDPDLLASLDAMLSHMRKAVRFAKDDITAVKLYRQHWDRVALVLIDIHLPGMNASVVLNALRQINPTVRCCFLCDADALADRPELLDREAFQRLRKPVLGLELAVVVSDIALGKP